MWSEFNYINIREVLSRVMRHPLMTDLTLEAAIQYTIDFMGAVGIPNVYIDKTDTVEIDDFRGLLPCDLVSIDQVRDSRTKTCMRSMTDNFNGSPDDRGEMAFKTQGRVIFTSFRNGSVEVAYKAVRTDDDGLPMLPDNPVFLKALELYIKKEWFTVLYDMGRISTGVLQNTQQEYYLKAGQCNNEFAVPSVSEMETITRMLNTLVPRVTDFDKSFRHQGDREYLKMQ